jgi:hypothetical protein
MKKAVIYLISFLVLYTIFVPQIKASEINPVDHISSIDASLRILANKGDLVQWLSVLIALLLGLIGIFKVQDLISNNLHRAILKVGIKLEPPDSLKIAMRNSQTGQFYYDVYYLRLRIENIGNSLMEEVEVIASELYKKRNNNRYSKVNSFLPMNLKWANFGELTMPKIQSKIFKHCDLGHIVESVNVPLAVYGLPTTSNVVIVLDTQVTPNTGSNILLPGEYKIKLVFAANNLSKTTWFKLVIRNAWSTNEQLMFANNISIQKIKGI